MGKRDFLLKVSISSRCLNPQKVWTFHGQQLNPEFLYKILSIWSVIALEGYFENPCIYTHHSLDLTPPEFILFYRNSGKCYSIRHWKFLEIQGEMFHRMESAQSVIALAGCFESPCIYIQHSLDLTTWTKHSISRVSCTTSAIKRAFGVGTIGVDMTVVSFRVAFFNVCNKYGHYGKTAL